MKRAIGCLSIIGRVALVVLAVVAIVLLANAAINGTRDLARRNELRQQRDLQSTVFPGTATALAAPNTGLLNPPSPVAVAMLYTDTPSPIPRSTRPAARPESATTAIPIAQLPTNTRRPTSTPDAPAATTPPPTVDPASLQPAGPTATLPRVIGPDECTSRREQPTAIPTRAPRLRPPEGQDVLNVLLLGVDSEVRAGDPSYGTDTMIVVSVNRTVGAVSMLSIPRDLYVCIPNLGMQRINVAYQWGESVGWQPNGGFGLLQETILYNLGIPVHFYARVSITGFRTIIDTLNGVDVAVDCPMINELRFTGQFDPQQTPIYEPFTLPVGYYHMDGSLALWYARVRKSTSDFDRNRRQQQILRAIWRTARDQGLISRAPDLYGQLTQIVTTNMQLTDVLGLVPIALNLQPGDIRQFTMVKGRELQHYRTPQGEDVQVPDQAGFFRTLNDLYTPPTANRLTQGAGLIEVVNGSGNADWDKVATDALGWLGFQANAAGPGEATSQTVIYDYTGDASPAVVALLVRTLNIRPDRVISQPDPNRTTDFRVILGTDYESCSAPGFGR